MTDPLDAGRSSRGSADRPGRQALVLVNDLMLGSRIRSVLEALKVQPIFPGNSRDAASSSLEAPALMIVDLDASALSPMEAIERSKRAGVPVLAYGSHVDGEKLEAARGAGADMVVARSAIAGRLDELILKLLEGISTS